MREPFAAIKSELNRELTSNKTGKHVFRFVQHVKGTSGGPCCTIPFTCNTCHFETAVYGITLNLYIFQEEGSLAEFSMGCRASLYLMENHGDDLSFLNMYRLKVIMHPEG